jgi:hypothetical protein
MPVHCVVQRIAGESTGQMLPSFWSGCARWATNCGGREPHVWGELRHILFKMNAELDWFEKYARKRPYTWEKAP